MKYNILFYHPSGLFYGGTEKLLQIMAKFSARDFNVFFAYSPKLGEQQKIYFEGTGVNLVPFDFLERQDAEPFILRGMNPAIKKIIEQYNIRCVCLPVFTRYQFPVNVIPATMPLVLTSPFGHYATNGNVRKVFVSGQSNLQRLRKLGVRQAELIFDPIEDFDPEYLKSSPVGETVVFGRVGRPDDYIFDPISLKAFALLEKKYGDRVRYEWLTPPPAAIELAKDLGIKNFIIDPGTGKNYLSNFYHRVDVLAHARKDGETFGKNIAEAMLAGLPILTHRSRYHNEHFKLLSGEYARWCEADDVEGYYKNMEWMIEHKDVIRTMGQKARARAKELFDPGVILPPILNIFMAACESCSYYKKGAALGGYLKLWTQNAKMLPYVLAKRLMRVVPAVDRLAMKIYNKHPLY